VDAGGLTARWTGAWGNCRPVGYELRACLHDRWVRFHSLPGSKRYAGNEGEYAELLRRHLTVLAGLLSRDSAGSERDLLVVTASWSGGPAPAPREAELAGVLPAADHWTSILTDDSVPGEATWTHLWVTAARFPGEDLSRLLRLVADYGTAGVIIITTIGLSWLYHPYDGGADVIAATPGQRDQLRRQYREWLSAHSAGL
jgi:hypothetical protein